MSAVPVEASNRRFNGAGWGQQEIVLLILMIFVGLLVLGPILILLRTSFAPSGTMPLETWRFSLEHYIALATSSSTWRLVFNTVIYALASMGIGVAIATAISWFTERTDMPGRVVVRSLMFSWMAVPALVVGFGWILLINPGNGALNVLFRELGGSGVLFQL